MSPLSPPARGALKTALRVSIGLAALAVLLTLAWTGFQRWRTPRTVPLPEGTAPVQRMEDLYSKGDAPMTLFLKVVDLSTGNLVNHPAVIRRSRNRLNQMKQAVLAYLRGPREGAVRVPGPEGMVLNELFLTPDGTAVVDMSLGPTDPDFGFWEEVLFVRGLLFVLNNHFPEAKRVRLLMDGRESGTLAGHYALGSPAVVRAVTSGSAPSD